MTLVQAGFSAVLLVGLFAGLAYKGRAYWGWVLALAGAVIALFIGGRGIHAHEPATG